METFKTRIKMKTLIIILLALFVPLSYVDSQPITSDPIAHCGKYHQKILHKYGQSYKSFAEAQRKAMAGVPEGYVLTSVTHKKQGGIYKCYAKFRYVG